MVEVKKQRVYTLEADNILVTHMHNSKKNKVVIQSKVRGVKSTSFKYDDIDNMLNILMRLKIEVESDEGK